MTSQNFLTEAQEARVIKAIQEAENKTSGEIRVHVEHHCKTEPLDCAARIFHELGMDQTEQQNGVLLYIASEDRKAAVYSGSGIHNQVEEGFWDDVLKLLIEHFKKGAFEEGIAKAVQKVGNKLEELFPYQRGDINELPNTISYHNNQNP